MWTGIAFAYGEYKESVGEFKTRREVVEALELLTGEEMKQSHKYGKGCYEYNHRHTVEKV